MLEAAGGCWGLLDVAGEPGPGGRALAEEAPAVLSLLMVSLQTHQAITHDLAATRLVLLPCGKPARSRPAHRAFSRHRRVSLAQSGQPLQDPSLDHDRSSFLSRTETA